MSPSAAPGAHLEAAGRRSRIQEQECADRTHQRGHVSPFTVDGFKSRIGALGYTEFMPRYNVQGYPTLIMFQNGKPIKTYQGRVDFDSLKAYI
eukprot:7996064-Pyramimonas_sp.AAC.1